MNFKHFRSVVMLASLLMFSAGAAWAQGKGKGGGATYNVTHQGSVIGVVTATGVAGGIDFGSGVQIDLSTRAAVTPTPIAPVVDCAVSNPDQETCLFDIETGTDKIRNVGSGKVAVYDCDQQISMTGLEAIPAGGTACARVTYFISDLSNLNWAARFNPENPNWPQSLYLEITRGPSAALGLASDSEWWIDTVAHNPANDPYTGDIAAITRNKTKKGAKGVVIEGFFSVPHAMRVVKQ